MLITGRDCVVVRVDALCSLHRKARVVRELSLALLLRASPESFRRKS